jgi:hypothetical protein
MGEYFFPQILGTPIAQLFKPDFAGAPNPEPHAGLTQGCTLCILCLSAILGLPRLKQYVAQLSAHLIICLRWSVTVLESLHSATFGSSPFPPAQTAFELANITRANQVSVGSQATPRIMETASQCHAGTSIAVQCDLVHCGEHAGHTSANVTGTILPRHLTRAFTLGTAFGRLSTDGFRRLSTQCGTPAHTLIDWWRRWQQTLAVTNGLACDPVIDVFFNDNSELALP